jgi:hypothetical protein
VRGKREKGKDKEAFMGRLVRFTTVMTVIAGVLMCAGDSILAQGEKKAADSGVAGKWTMSVDGGPHGATTMGLRLEQKGKKVTGTFASPHGDVPVEGEFAEGALKLATVVTGGEGMRVTFNAKLKEGGTLAGYLSSEMGDMKWTAERVKEK